MSLCGKHSSFTLVWAQTGRLALTKSRMIWRYFLPPHSSFLGGAVRTTARSCSFFTVGELVSAARPDGR